MQIEIPINRGNPSIYDAANQQESYDLQSRGKGEGRYLYFGKVNETPDN